VSVASIGPLISCQGVSKSFGMQTLFADVSISLSKGDCLGLIGPNGSGKSTLLKILAGLETADSGTVSVRKLTRVGCVMQDCSYDPELTVYDVLLDVVQAACAGTPDPDAEQEARLAEAFGLGGFLDKQQKVGTLSGGWTRRLAIVAALAEKPDVLLLDEPTNHLDLAGLRWLERLLPRAPFATLVVSHDRRFLETVATRLVELNRIYPGGSISCEGPYSAFLDRRAAFLSDQAADQVILANKVRREVEWLRRGPKARATKAQSRVDEAHRLIDRLSEVSARNVTQDVRIDFSGTERKTKRLLVTRQISKKLGGRMLISGLDLVLSPGMRVGIAGANGSGKTTLLRMLAGEIAPDEGIIERAPALDVVYFDQKREQLDPAATLRRALAPDGDQVIYRGTPIHVVGWAKRFLFRADQLETPVGTLSGGERARILIANLMLRPADLLLLDEPTNDLDIPTLEVLEESLLDFPGSVVLVTHDRYMMDRVATGLIGLDGTGGTAVYADLVQWEEAMAAARVRPETTVVRKPREKAQVRRLTYLEQREFEGMESTIVEAEEVLDACSRDLEDPAIATNAGRLQQCSEAYEAARSRVDTLYARWAELEGKLAEEQP